MHTTPSTCARDIAPDSQRRTDAGICVTSGIAVIPLEDVVLRTARGAAARPSPHQN